MSTEETKVGVTVDPSSVRSLTGRSLVARVAALASTPEVADDATVDRRKSDQERRRSMNQ